MPVNLPQSPIALTGVFQTVYLQVNADVYDRLILSNISYYTLDIYCGQQQLRLQPNTVDILRIDGARLDINPISVTSTAAPQLELQAVRVGEELTESYPIALQAGTNTPTFAAVVVTGSADFQAGAQFEGALLLDANGDAFCSLAHPAFGNTKPDGNTDNTQQLLNAITAIKANKSGGRARLFLDPGIWTFDLGTVYGTIHQITAAAGIPSNVTVFGAGIDVSIVRIKGVGRNPTNNDQSIFVNDNPDIGNSGVCFYDFTLDGNRQNQGPYSYNISVAGGGPGQWTSKGIYLFKATDCDVDRIKVINFSFIGVYAEDACQNVHIGTVIGENCTGTLAFDSGTNMSWDTVIAWNHDPIAIINTTTNTNIPGNAVTVVTPASMANILINTPLDIDLGTANHETVLVTAVTGTTFTAFFGNAHAGPGTPIKSAIFRSDAAAQCGPGVVGCAIGKTVVDYVNAQAIFGPGLEIFGCHEITVGPLRVRGAWKAIWIHNWTILGTHHVVHDVVSNDIQGTNLQASNSGLVPIGIHLDDQGYLAAEAVSGVQVAGEIKYGQDGVTIPAGACAFQDSTNTKYSARVHAVGAQHVLSTQLGAAIDLYSEGSTGRGVYAPGCKSTRGDITVINPTLQGIALDGNPGCQGNDWDILVTGAPNPYPGLTGQFGGNHFNNRFRGTCVGNGGGAYIPPTVGTTTNDVHLVGYNPVGVVVVAVPATGVAVAAAPYDRTFYVTAAAGGATTMTIQNGPAIVIPANQVVAVHVPQGLTVTPTYGGGNAPTWVVEGE